MTFLHKLAKRLARLKAALVIALVAAVACERPAAITDPSGFVIHFSLSPKSLSVFTDQTTEFVAVGLTPAGDTVDVAVTWSVTGGSMLDTSSTGRKHYGRYKSPSLPGRQTIKAQAAASGAMDSAIVSVT